MLQPTTNHPKVGTLQQYKKTEYAKVIPTNYLEGDSISVRKDGYLYSLEAGFVFAPYIPVIQTPVFNVNIPLSPPLPVFPSPQPSPYVEVKPQRKDQVPWKYGMPWCYYKKAAPEHTRMAKNSEWGFDYTNERPKYTIMPLEAITFESKLKGSSLVLGRTTYLKCYLINPSDPAQDVPDTVWLKEDWLEPHTGKEHKQESDEALKARWKTKLEALKKK